MVTLAPINHKFQPDVVSPLVGIYSKDTELPSDYQPGPHDVISGRGKKCFDHIGNRRFRTIIEEYHERFTAAPSRHAKSLIVIEIVDVIRSAPGGVYFVRQLKDKSWVEIGDVAAREKTSQALRRAATEAAEAAAAEGGERKTKTSKSASCKKSLKKKNKKTRASSRRKQENNNNKDGNNNKDNAMFSEQNDDFLSHLLKNGIGEEDHGLCFDRDDEGMQSQSSTQELFASRASLCLPMDAETASPLPHESSLLTFDKSIESEEEENKYGSEEECCFLSFLSKTNNNYSSSSSSSSFPIVSLVDAFNGRQEDKCLSTPSTTSETSEIDFLFSSAMKEDCCDFEPIPTDTILSEEEENEVDDLIMAANLFLPSCEFQKQLGQ